MEPVRLGFIGAGEMACWAIYPALHFAPINLVAVCDVDAQKAKIAAEKFGSDSWHTDYQQMFIEADVEAPSQSYAS